MAVKPGNYLTLTRRWQNGDVVELRLPLALRVRPSVDDLHTVSLFYGPVVLAGELGRDGMPASDIAGKDAHLHAPAYPAPVFVGTSADLAGLPVKPEAGAAPLTFQAQMMNLRDQREVQVRLSPLYRVHHQRFAVYWKILTPEQFKELAKQQAAESVPAAGFVGNAEAEKALNFQGKRSSTGQHQGRTWRDAKNGGWFSYRLPVDANADVNLLCTYWGGETGNRVFDIVVENKTITTQTLNRNQPGKFFDAAYRIPADLVSGKQFITVRFQAHAGAKAGGLFDCRIVPAAPGK